MRRVVSVLAAVFLCQLGGCTVPGIGLADDCDSTCNPPLPTCNDQTCGAVGGTCESADRGRVCLLLDQPCATNQESVCMTDGIHGCERGFPLAASEESCQAFEQCYEATVARGNANISYAYCAVDSAPCRTASDGECRGNVEVQCNTGFPDVEINCDDIKRVCKEYSESGHEFAVCAEDLTCPADLSPQVQPLGVPLLLACANDAVIDCESDQPLPFTMALCPFYGEHCSTGGITTCTVSASGPAAPEWRSLPAGNFTPTIGSIAGVSTDVAAFEMLRTEVTIGQFDACVQAGPCLEAGFGCNPRTLRGDQPLNCALEPTAEQYCEWLGGRLPTAAEWEYAARNAGADVIFPWGDDPATEADIGLDNCDGDTCDPGPAIGCQHARDITAQGICDLAGNLEEWVARVDPKGASLRGQSYANLQPATLGGIDALDLPPESEGMIGFRCVR